MKKPAHVHLSDLRGFQRLAVDATVGLADLVEAMHHTITKVPGPLGKAPKGRTRGITGFVYRSVRGVTRLVGLSVDGLLGLLTPLIAEKRSSQERETVLAALNGVLGDYLAESGNPLAIAMGLRKSGTPVALNRAALAAAFPKPGGRVLVLLHGLCMNDLQWNREGHDHGAALARDLGYTPLYVHYNTGRHISANGRDFADLMETLLREWPHPVAQLAILGHSMGGLVARSACHYAALAGHDWRKRLDPLVMLGSPHFGAPLERAGTRVDYLLGISPYTAPFARLGKVRSAGIKDLSHGHLRDEDWQPKARAETMASHSPVPLPGGVRCYVIAASRQEHPPSPGARTRGDELVPVNSALGRHRDPRLSLAIPETSRWVGYGMGHFDLLSRGDVYEKIRGWLAAPSGRPGDAPRNP
ncbi:MAG: alpha/beta hydrolase [Betaproteobacteria bacterium]|nr:alpha/beta hydrolase [Betaproteobacteria bacterium]